LNLYFNWFLAHAVNSGWFCFWRRQSVFLRMKYLGNRWTNLRQIHTEDVLVLCSDELKGRRQRSRSQGTKTAFLALSAACVRFMLGKKIFSLYCLPKVSAGFTNANPVWYKCGTWISWPLIPLSFTFCGLEAPENCFSWCGPLKLWGPVQLKSLNILTAGSRNIL